MPRALLAVMATATAGLALSGCTTAPPEPIADAPPPMSAPGSLTAAPTYLQMAASSDQYEIQSSQMAMQMSQNPALHSMAQMLITDHTRTSSELMAAAQSARVPMPPLALAPHHAQMLNQLRSAGPNFDMVYRDQQITAHQEALNLHQTYATGGDVAALRAVAARAVPVIQMHLQHAQATTAGPGPATGGTMPSTQSHVHPGERG